MSLPLLPAEVVQIILSYTPVSALWLNRELREWAIPQVMTFIPEALESWKFGVYYRPQYLALSSLYAAIRVATRGNCTVYWPYITVEESGYSAYIRIDSRALVMTKSYIMYCSDLCKYHINNAWWLYDGRIYNNYSLFPSVAVRPSGHVQVSRVHDLYYTISDNQTTILVYTNNVNEKIHYWDNNVSYNCNNISSHNDGEFLKHNGRYTDHISVADARELVGGDKSYRLTRDIVGRIPLYIPIPRIITAIWPDINSDTDRYESV